jgi:hypothetical protein
MNDQGQIPRVTKRFGTIPEWIADSGMGRTKTYEKIGEGVIRAVKADGRTLIDYDSGFAYLNSLPPAEIRRPGRHVRAGEAQRQDAVGIE